MPRQLTSEEFRNIYKKAPRLCVELIVKSNDGILLTLRNIPPSKDFWHLPGGSVLHGETLEEAAERISQVELGVKAKVEKYLGIVEYFGKSTIFGHALAVELLVKLKSTQIKLDRQASKYAYFKNIPDKTIKETKGFLKAL
ncbi:NUDIX domain-containing protein [Candidatus Daviesbacteria bacterium]|nr:NUDIX domain-containing protein [Candidatus Daviesbacteria bacterium]